MCALVLGGSLEVRKRTRKNCSSQGEDSLYILIDDGKGERLHLYIGQLCSWNRAISMIVGAHHVVLLAPFFFCREIEGKLPHLDSKEEHEPSIQISEIFVFNFRAFRPSEQ